VTQPRHASTVAALSLDFERDAESGRTLLAASAQEPPLRVVRAFDMDDGAALAHLHNVSGGLLGGDRLSLKVKLGAGARAQVTTTGATRIYRRRSEDSATTQLNQIEVGENALLEYVPDSIIPFAGSRFSQDTSICLSTGAGLFWWEILAPGREAKGEQFEYERVEMKTNLWVGGRRAAAERIRMEPRSRDVHALGRLGEYSFWATLYICREGIDARRWIETEEKLREASAEFVTGAARWGVSTLVTGGLVVRGVAHHGRDMVAGLHGLWRAGKKLLYGCEPILPRKVN
jgi:urease accessory protein